MNGDNYVDEYDLYSCIKNSTESLFIESLNQDFKDIRVKMAFKGKDTSMDYKKNVDEKGNITDLKRWLEDQKFHRDVQ